MIHGLEEPSAFNAAPRALKKTLRNLEQVEDFLNIEKATWEAQREQRNARALQRLAWVSAFIVIVTAISAIILIEQTLMWSVGFLP